MGLLDSLFNAFGSSSPIEGGLAPSQPAIPDPSTGGLTPGNINPASGGTTGFNAGNTTSAAPGTLGFNAGGPTPGQPAPAQTPDPLGPSANHFVNSFESTATTGKPLSSALGTGAAPASGSPKTGESFINSYEGSVTQLSQNVAAPADQAPKADVSGSQPDAGGKQDGGGGSKPPTQQGGGTAPEPPKIRPDLGDSVKSFESGNRGVASVSTGVKDPGGVSYGTYQLSTNAGTMTDFLKSPEAAKYAHEFSGLTPGSPEFSAKWTEIADRDPDGLHQAEKAYIYRTHYQPRAKEAAELGYDMNNPALQDAVWSGSLQHRRNFSSILRAAADKYTPYRWADDQLQRIYEARADRYTLELPPLNRTPCGC